MNLNQLKKADLIKEYKKLDLQLAEERGAYIEDINKERDNTRYLLMTLEMLKGRFEAIKKVSNPRSLKFFIRLLFDKQLRNGIRAILEFDIDYIKSVTENNGGEYFELSDGLQKSSLI